MVHEFRAVEALGLHAAVEEQVGDVHAQPAEEATDGGQTDEPATRDMSVTPQQTQR